MLSEIAIGTELAALKESYQAEAVEITKGLLKGIM
jgi:hypothetical protein